MAKLKKYQYGGAKRIITEARKMAAPSKVSPILKSKMQGFEPSIHLAPSRAAFRARMRKTPVLHEIIRGPVAGDPSIAYKIIPPPKPISKRKDFSELLRQSQQNKIIDGSSLRNPKKHR